MGEERRGVCVILARNTGGWGGDLVVVVRPSRD